MSVNIPPLLNESWNELLHHFMSRSISSEANELISRIRPRTETGTFFFRPSPFFILTDRSVPEKTVIFVDRDRPRKVHLCQVLRRVPDYRRR